MVQATAKCATSRLMIAVLFDAVLWSDGRVVEVDIGNLPFNESSVVSCSFCGLVAYWLWRRTNLRLSVW